MEKYAVLIIALLHFGKANNQHFTAIHEITKHLEDLTKHIKHSSSFQANCSVHMAESLRNLLGKMTINSGGCKDKHPSPTAQTLLYRLSDGILSKRQGVHTCMMKFGQCEESLEIVALLHGYTKLFADWKKASNKK